MATLPYDNLMNESSAMTLEENLAETEYSNFYPARSYGSEVNYRKRKWHLYWGALLKSERDELVAFFEAHSLIVPFEWTAFNDTQERSWVFTDVLVITNVGGDKYDVTVNILEEFTP